MVTKVAANNPPVSIEDCVKEATLPFEHPLFEDIDKFQVVYSFAELSTLGVFGRGYRTPVSWVANKIYDTDSRNLSPEEIIKTVGNGIIINVFPYAFSHSVKRLNCGVISASSDGRYLSWKPFIG